MDHHACNEGTNIDVIREKPAQKPVFKQVIIMQRDTQLTS